MRAPSAARIRPHDGSPPKIPDFTRLPPATARARSRAISRSGTPATSTMNSLLAPSPSAAIALARSAQRLVSVASRVLKAALPGSIAGAPEAPLASAMTVSLVDMSPSTVMVLNVSSTADTSARCSVSGATRASVVMKQSMVAIWGWIIPDPLAMAAKRTVLPPSSISRKASLVRRSVVRIASAAAATSSPSAATSAGAAAVIRSTGIRMPIPPVEAVRTSSAPTPSALATAVAMARSSAALTGPVSALALPLLATMARIRCPGNASPNSGPARRTSC